MKYYEAPLSRLLRWDDSPFVCASKFEYNSLEKIEYLEEW